MPSSHGGQFWRSLTVQNSWLTGRHLLLLVKLIGAELLTGHLCFETGAFVSDNIASIITS